MSGEYSELQALFGRQLFCIAKQCLHEAFWKSDLGIEIGTQPAIFVCVDRWRTVGVDRGQHSMMWQRFIAGVAIVKPQSRLNQPQPSFGCSGLAVGRLSEASGSGKPTTARFRTGMNNRSGCTNWGAKLQQSWSARLAIRVPGRTRQIPGNAGPHAPTEKNKPLPRKQMSVCSTIQTETPLSSNSRAIAAPLIPAPRMRTVGFIERVNRMVKPGISGVFDRGES